MIPIELISFVFVCFSLSLFCIVLLSIITGYDFDEVFRDFHATVDHDIAMVGYENARDDPLLDGREYATTFSIMEALGNPNPEDFVKIFHDRLWDDKSIDGRRLSRWSDFWKKTGNAFKCAGTALGAAWWCAGGYGVSWVAAAIDQVDPPCYAKVNNTKNNC